MPSLIILPFHYERNVGFNYQKALVQLTKFIEKGELSELEEQGIIKAFEYTYELAWKVIKDYYEEQGEVSIQGS
jgi:hypothetical protein